MSPRSVLLAAAGMLVVAGCLLGAIAPSVGDTSCGTAFTGVSNAAKAADFGDELLGTMSGMTPDVDTTNVQDACSGKIGDRRLPAFGLIGLGLIAGIASQVAAGAAHSGPMERDPRFRI